MRASEAHRMIREGYEPVLKKKRWCLLKRPENLTDKQRICLRELLGYNLKIALDTWPGTAGLSDAVSADRGSLRG